MQFDVLIEKGTIVDGTGAARFEADVGISGGKIAAVRALPESEALQLHDATGHIVASGLIDMHSHSDITVLYDPRGEIKANQGVTTEVVGTAARRPSPQESSRGLNSRRRSICRTASRRSRSCRSAYGFCQNSGHEGVIIRRNLTEESPHELSALSVDRRLREEERNYSRL